MLHQPVALPQSDEARIREPNRMLQHNSPALAGADGERLDLPNAVYRLLKNAGDLPHRRAGSHRRIYLKDLVAYRKRRDAERKAALDSIAKEAFESGLHGRTGIPEGGEDE